jgi:hypothetical protein
MNVALVKKTGTGSLGFEFEAAKRAIRDLAQKLAERDDCCCELTIVQGMIGDLNRAQVIYDDIL